MNTVIQASTLSQAITEAYSQGYKTAPLKATRKTINGRNYWTLLFKGTK